MQVELDQRTFGRLVKLYLLTLLGSVAGFVVEFTSSNWISFSEEFDLLARAYFPPLPDVFENGILVVGLGVFAWHFIAAVGLLWYKDWARFGFSTSLVIMLLITLLPPFQPFYQSPWSSLIAVVAGVLTGAILLLAYARSYGGTWFMKPLERMKEIF